ncbi:MAG TPA: hypothetical protein VFW22_17525 [Pseudolabrys sp.]|nr:hypothetical protein [Pseudolabrys sp.]
MIAYVNGYVCTTPCEAAAARKGHDPFAPPGTPPDQAKNDKTPGIDGQPAVTFGGALANLNEIDAVTPAGAPAPSNQRTLNVLV